MLEVATFYTMFNLAPVGKFHVQMCGTTPCMLRGADALLDICNRRIGHQMHVTADGKFSWVEVECLGACVNAPMVQINYDYYEDLTPESFEKILDELAAGRTPEARARRSTASSPRRSAGATTLKDDDIGPRCSQTRTASSAISTARATGASRARARAAPGTAPRASSRRAATGWSTR